jgi:hypothetical protein
VHKHVLITLPIVTISDDKNHDTAFVQKWLDNFFKKDGWLDTQDEIPNLKGRVSEILINSDGAASHFKSKFTLSYLLYLQKTYRLKFSWMVGGPGHGKGEHDGIGGITKRRAERLILDRNLHLENAFELFQVVYDEFAAEAAVTKMRLEKSRRYRRWYVLYLSEDNTKLSRRSEDEIDIVTPIIAFKQIMSQGIGTRGIFWFETTGHEAPDSLTYRLRGCCCTYCQSACRPGIGYDQ